MSSAADPTTLSADIEEKISPIEVRTQAVYDDDGNEIEWTEDDELYCNRAMKKVDWTLVPLFGCVYMMSALDRSNIGNAALTTFKKDLNLKGNEYQYAVSVLFATYVFFEPWWALGLKKFTPRRILTFSCICWSAITVGGAFVKNYHQLIAIRLILGLFEAAIAPCISLYLTMVYMRNEYVKRQTLINSCSALSGAFGGLLAYGLTQIDHAGLKGWQWMYLVEGLMSFCLVPFTALVLPNRPTELRFLKPEERAALEKRTIMNRRYYDERDEFSWKVALSAFKDWRMYFHNMNHFSINVTLYTLTTFMPSLCAGLGFTTRVQSQLLTVPVYFIASATFIFIGWKSDKYELRSPFIIGALTCNLVGYIILVAAPQVGVRYAGIFISSFGLYIATALNNLWAADNHAPHYKRAIVCSFNPTIGNVAGAVVPFVFTSKSAPRYLKGLYFDIAFTIWAMVCTSVLAAGTWRMIKQKEKAIAEGAPDDPSLGDKNPHYRFFM